MFRQALRPWYESRYTGLFTRCGLIPLRPHDPAVAVWSGTLPRWGADGTDLATGGAGWDRMTAEGAGVGEAVERWLPHALPQDAVIESSFAAWKLDEAAIGPERWVPFHPEQFAQPGFPYVPWTADVERQWVCCREAGSGLPAWVPLETVFLAPRAGSGHAFGPLVSTGLSCGRAHDPVLLRGLQEVIERDALVGAWWGSYALEEHDPARVLHLLDADKRRRLLRPNLTYRCYRVATPYSAHVTVATITGEDREGFCFSVGSACRETRAASWEKALLEAIQGRHYVRYLKTLQGEPVAVPVNFAGHAIYYSEHPSALAATVLNQPTAPSATKDDGKTEGFAALVERLGSRRSMYFRHLTPPPLREAGLDYVVVRVLVPGLQPLHGHHQLAYLGGPLWQPRGLGDYANVPPHPFP